MQLLNLLALVELPVFGQTYDISLDWIGQFIQFLVSGVGVGVGIILFSLILKVIVLPFDVFQRISMRKQNVKMKEQQEKMEKLQKQYANNQELYNQKVMEMYKENGISMFSSCLPMILSMVIFFVAIGAFNAYAQYASVQSYNDLADAYNAKIESYCPDLETATLAIDGETIVVSSDDAYIYYTVNKGEFTSETQEGIKEYIASNEAIRTKKYFVSDKATEIEEIGNAEDQAAAAKAYFTEQGQLAALDAYENVVSQKTNFLWIKNIWVTDASYKHPLLPFSEFEAGLKNGGGCFGCFGGRNIFNVNGEKVVYTELETKTGTQVYKEDVYNIVTGKLEMAKSEPNGYFILIALSIGTILLQQFVSMRSQKEQQKYSTVDGQGASSQKMTMVMMTAMFAIFSFMYSSAFSIYLIVSNVFSLASTLIINKGVDTHMNKKSTEATKEKMDNRGLSRIEAAKNAGRASAQESRGKKADKNEK